MLILFLGNCQVESLAGIINRFVVPYGDVTTSFIDTYHALPPDARQRVQDADAIVLQESLRPTGILREDLPAGTPVYTVPLVNGSFLFPYQGMRHPLQPEGRYGVPAYPDGYNDRYLSKLITRGVSPEAALAQYKAFDVATVARVGRLHELAMESQRELDAVTGYDCAGIIDRHLADEQIFQSAYHFGGRFGRHLTSTLCDRLGFDAAYGERIRAHLRDAPFVARFVPVHPSVARYFGMSWVTEQTRYPYLWEGGLTFDEYVLRYMEARWNPLLLEGVIEARRGEAGARAKLEAALESSPRSATGAHELSRLLEKDGDLDGAVAWQRRAVESGGHMGASNRLGVLLRKQGRLEAAAEAFAEATRDDPVSPAAWGHLRDCLVAQSKFGEAVGAAEQAVMFAVNRVAAERALENVRKKAVLF